MSLIATTYLPREMAKRSDWLQNLATALPQYATTLGITPAQLSALQEGADAYAYFLGQMTGYVRSFSKGVTSILEEIDTDATPAAVLIPQFTPPAPPAALGQTGVISFAVGLVEIMEKSGNLSPAIRAALLLDPLAPTSPIGPKIRGAEALPNGEVDLTFTRGGYPLVILESRRGGGGWEVLDKIAATSYADTRPNAVAGVSESRSYRIRYSDGKNAIGDYSETFSVATQA